MSNAEDTQKHRIPLIAKLAAVVVSGSLLSQGSIFGFVVFAALVYEFSKRDAEQPEETEGMSLVGGMLWVGLAVLGVFALGYFAFGDFLANAEVRLPVWFSEMFSLQFASFYTGAVLGFLILLGAPLFVVALVTGAWSRSPAVLLHRVASVVVLVGVLLISSVLLAELGFALVSHFQPAAFGLQNVVPWSVLSWRIAMVIACLTLGHLASMTLSKRGAPITEEDAANRVGGSL